MYHFILLHAIQIRVGESSSGVSMNEEKIIAHLHHLRFDSEKQHRIVDVISGARY